MMSLVQLFAGTEFSTNSLLTKDTTYAYDPDRHLLQNQDVLEGQPTSKTDPGHLKGLEGYIEDRGNPPAADIVHQ